MSTYCKLFKLFKYCFGTWKIMSYNEDDAWGSPHRTINTLNTTGINCRFPKVNFLWSYFLLAFKWKYCSYNLNKPRYIALNGTHMIQENIVFTLLFLSSGQFMASKINWGCEVDPLKQILGIFFFPKKGMKLHSCFPM